MSRANAMRYMRGQGKQLRAAARLDDLAAHINDRHDAANEAAQTAIGHAAECGRLLIEAKEQVQHGEWLPWIEANLSFGPRQAQKYMRLTEHADTLSNATSNSHLSIDAALQTLAEPQPESPEISNAVSPPSDLLAMLTPPPLAGLKAYDRASENVAEFVMGLLRRGKSFSIPGDTRLLFRGRSLHWTMFVWASASGNLTMLGGHDDDVPPPKKAKETAASELAPSMVERAVTRETKVSARTFENDPAASLSDYGLLDSDAVWTVAQWDDEADTSLARLRRDTEAVIKATGGAI